MNTTTLVVATAAIVVAGKFQKREPITVKIAVGGAGLAVGLALLSSANEKFAKLVGYMVLLAAAYIYLPGLVKQLGFSGETEKANRRKL